MEPVSRRSRRRTRWSENTGSYSGECQGNCSSISNLFHVAHFPRFSFTGFGSTNFRDGSQHCPIFSAIKFRPCRVLVAISLRQKRSAGGESHQGGSHVLECNGSQHGISTFSHCFCMSTDTASLLNTVAQLTGPCPCPCHFALQKQQEKS